MNVQIRILLFFIILSLGKAGAQSLPFTHYTTDGELTPLPSAEVHKVYQDRIGYVWFAIYSSGLVRYNGTGMEVFDTEDGLRDLSVWDLTEDPSGRLWVSSNTGLVVSEKPLQDYRSGEPVQFVTRVGDVELADVSINHNRMAVGSKNRLWAGTDNLGIIRYRFTPAGKLEADTLSTNASGTNNPSPVRAIASKNDGSTWAALIGGDIIRYSDEGDFELYNSGNGKNISSLHADSQDNLWGGEQEGRIWRIDENKDAIRFIEVNNQLSSNIANIFSDSEGTVWASSEGSGLLKIVPGSESENQIYNRTNGLLSEVIYNVLEDKENNLWIAQSGGVSKLRYNYKAFTNLTADSYAGEQPVLPSASIGSVISSPGRQNPCRIWAGTSEGGAACIGNNIESEYISQENGLSNNWVNGIAYDASGRLWIGTVRGLNSIVFENTKGADGASDSEPVTVFGKPATLFTYPSASILAATSLKMSKNRNSDEKIESTWFPAYHKIYVVVNDQFYTIDDSHGLPAAIYHTAAFDGDGHLWLGTRDRGIIRSNKPFYLGDLQLVQKPDEYTNAFESWWSTESGAPTNQVDKLLWVDENMWVGTPAGLVALEKRPTGIKHLINSKNGLPADNATSFDLSPVTGTLWVGTNRGLAEIDPEAGKVIKTVTRTDGLVDNEVWFYGSVHVAENGIVYYGTANGVTLYNPAADLRNEYPPIVKLTGVLSEQIQGERNNQFRFDYAALSFGNERQIRYQTRLTGFNDEWSAEKTDTRENFTNLPAIFFPRDYTFEVRAINESGVMSVVPLSYNFSVSPPALLSWWAFFGYFLILGAVVFGANRIQRERLLKKEREAAHLRETELKADAAEAQAKALKAENELKATELEKARELEVAYHELKSAQKRLIQAEKMASLGRLSTGIAHEIKNPLNFINNFSEVSKELVDELKDAINSGDAEEITSLMKNLRFNTEKIEEHGKRADSIVKSMMHHSRGGHEKPEAIDLNKVIQKYADLSFHGRKMLKSELDVELKMDLDPAVQRVEIMAQKMGQVLQNIIENAIDSVWEFAKSNNKECKPRVHIRSIRHEDQVEIKISDNGPGIPENAREKIFEPFYTTKPTGEGTGLGLSLSYDIITQMHNGKLEVGSSDMGGALFTIVLPSVNSKPEGNIS